MKSDPNNPSANELPKGISETSLVAAIEASGYPLQGVVADELARQQFGVEEEWDYIDDDTDERRNIDVFAFRRLSEPEKRWDNDAAIVLLIECKKSRHPYVFFRRMTPARLAGLPAVAGLRTVTIGESKPRNARYREMSPSEALGLSDLAFRAQGPAECSSLARGRSQGDKVELSGEDVYRDMVLPLAKATRHAQTIYARDVPAAPVVVLSIAVLDAPMLLVHEPSKANEPVLTPWLRIVRRESHIERAPRRPVSQFYAVDVVHAGYFHHFITGPVQQLTVDLTERLVRCPGFWKARGTVENLDSCSWRDVRGDE